jgi:hypothetical protein
MAVFDKERRVVTETEIPIATRVINVVESGITRA